MRAMRRGAVAVGISSALALGLAVGCEEQPVEPVPTDPSVTESVEENVREGEDALQGAMEGAQDRLSQGREQVVTTAERQVEGLRQQIDSLKERAEGQNLNLDERWTALRTRLDEGLESVETRLGELRDADTGSWQRVSNGLQESMEDLRGAYRDASAYLQEKLGGG